MESINAKDFTNALKSVLDETFDNVKNHYLDDGTSLFETLAGISAALASIPVGGKCATLAAQVKHSAFFLDFVVDSATDPNYPGADWGDIWNTVSVVTDEEWQAFQSELRQSYDRILVFIDATPGWSEAEISGAISVVAHTAYHLGEIRQALCALM